MSLWIPAKAKVQLRLSVQRLRTLQQKKEAQAKMARRDIASLVEKGKLETARIKVEAIVNEDIHIELLELLELYCELLLARFGLLDQQWVVPLSPSFRNKLLTRDVEYTRARSRDVGLLIESLFYPNQRFITGIREGVCSVIHAAPRTELKELHILRDILMHKYGREFSAAVMENRDGCVSPRVMSKLVNDTPSPALVNAYLREITKAYGVAWSDPDAADTKDPEPESEETPNEPEPTLSSSEAKEGSDNLKEKLKDKENEKAQSAPTPQPKITPPKVETPAVKKVQEEEEDFQALLKRFSDLKKR